MYLLAKTIASNLPPGSTAMFSLVADRNVQLNATDNVPLDVSNSNKISASAIEAAITETFPTGRFKMKAEIVYLLVRELTPIEVPPILLKKKTFVIVIGASIPASLRRIASSEGHIYLVQNIDDIASVGELVKNQTCQDSQYVCDVDEYKESRKRYSSCKDCLYVCSQRRIEVTHCPVCPYMRLPPKTQEVISWRRKDEHVPFKYIKDNKSNAVIAVVLSIIAICVVIGVLTSVFICHRRNAACFDQTPQRQIVELRDQQFSEGNVIADVEQEAEAGDQVLPLLPRQGSVSESHNRDDGTAHVQEQQDYINLRHSHSQCGVEEASL